VTIFTNTISRSSFYFSNYSGVTTLVNQSTISNGTTDGVHGTGGIFAVTNASTGHIHGNNGIYLSGSSTLTPEIITNAGTVSGVAYGVRLRFDGVVLTNQTGATIVGGSGFLDDSAATIVNDGLISGTKALGAGLNLGGGGTVTNQSHGTISADYAIRGGAAALTIVNAGKIAGANYTAIDMNGMLTNSGVITGVGYGVRLTTGGTLTNSGTISGTGVIPTTTNAARGVYLSYTTLIAQGGGTISGTGYAVYGYSASVDIDPGATFIGKVAVSGGTLTFESGASAGTLSGIGSHYSRFAGVTIASGANWTVTGTNAVVGYAMVNSGTLDLVSGTLSDNTAFTNNGIFIANAGRGTLSAIQGAGGISLQSGGSLTVQGSIASTETIDLSGAGAYLHLIAPSSMHGHVTGLKSGETIDLSGVALASVSYANHTLTAGSSSFALTLAAGSTFQKVTSADGTAITAICFLAGTMIATPRGDVPVEALAVGYIVRTWSGAERPITWIGRGTVMVPRGRRSASHPVTVRAGALSDGVPSRDLHVTKGHSLYLDDVLIPVEFLVNHRSIVWNDAANEVTIYHIELDAHDILVANGAPAESYRDDGNRWLFQNGNADREAAEKPHFAPVLTGGPVVDAVWRRLLDRCGPAPVVETMDDPDLHLLADEERIDAIWRDGRHFLFSVPHGLQSLRIRSRASAPVGLGLARDPRVLGVAIAEMTRTAEGVAIRRLGYDDPLLADGFHDAEHECGWRWTDGDAAVPGVLFAGLDGPFVLELVVPSVARYPLETQEVLRAA
jgi:Hint domain